MNKIVRLQTYLEVVKNQASQTKNQAKREFFEREIRKTLFKLKGLTA